MENKAGQKECPRCGLKNRQTAHQCDFCGWDFGTSDDWLEIVDELERIGREPAARKIDQSTTARIELTVKDPAKIKIAPLLAEENVPQEDVEKPELEPEVEADSIDVVEAAGSEEEIVPADVPASDAMEGPSFVEDTSDVAGTALMEEPEIVVPENAPADGSVTEEIAPDPVSEPTSASAVHQSAKGTDRSNRLDVFVIAILLTGIAIYIGALLVSPALGKAAGWVLAIIGAVLITIAVGKLLSLKGKGEDDEIVLCSNCHEVVSDADCDCPSCGAKFTRPMVKE